MLAYEKDEINLLSTIQLFVSLAVFGMRLEKANLPYFNIAFDDDGLSFLENVKDVCPKFHDWPIKDRDLDRLKEFNPDSPIVRVKNHYPFFTICISYRLVI